MKKVIKQVLGLDVAQKEMVVCLGRMYDDLQIDLYAYRTFSNSAKGFSEIIKWVSTSSDPSTPVRYVMEATGVYHEAMAYFLKDRELDVSIVLPNKISNYARSLSIKTVTDKTAAQAIAQFGLERQLDSWERPNPLYRQLRHLTRERDQIIAERTMIKNQLHAEKAQAESNNTSISRANKRIQLLNKQEKEIVAEIAEWIKSNEKVKSLVDLLQSISGIGKLTAVIVLAETEGFNLIRNKKQLTSYAGLDVREKQSGTSVKGKPKISKRGNRYLRKAMHLPALSAIRCDERFKAIFARLVSKHGIKMKAAVAIQRKLLEMCYTVVKTNTKYNKDYLQLETIEQSQVA